MTLTKLFIPLLFLCFDLSAQHEFFIDSSFAQNGFLETDSSEFYVTDSNAILMVKQTAHSLDFSLFDAEGEVKNNWGQNGMKRIELDSTYSIRHYERLDNGGYIIGGKLASGDLFSIKLLDEEKRDSSFANAGELHIRTPLGAHHTLENGDTYVVQSQGSDVDIFRLKSDASIDSTFGTNGLLHIGSTGGETRSALSFGELSNDIFVVSGTYEGGSLPMYAWAAYLYIFDKNGHFLNEIDFFPASYGGLAPYQNGSALVGFSNVYKPGDKSAKIVKVNQNGQLQQFSSASEAAHFTWDTPDVYAYITDLQKNDQGAITAFGNYFNTQPLGLKLFVKKMDANGFLDPTFGINGSIFFKKPDLPEAYYYTSNFEYLPNNKMLLSVGIQAPGKDRSNYLVRLDLNKKTISAKHKSPNFDWLVQGNPVQNTCTFISEKTKEDAKQFLLFDAQGQQVHQRSFSGKRLIFEANTLQSGLYFFKIMSSAGVERSGKLIVE